MEGAYLFVHLFYSHLNSNNPLLASKTYADISFVFSFVVCNICNNNGEEKSSFICKYLIISIVIIVTNEQNNQPTAHGKTSKRGADTLENARLDLFFLVSIQWMQTIQNVRERHHQFLTKTWIDKKNYVLCLLLTMFNWTKKYLQNIE